MHNYLAETDSLSSANKNVTFQEYFNNQKKFQ
jgi:hypothetical protein